MSFRENVSKLMEREVGIRRQDASLELQGGGWECEGHGDICLARRIGTRIAKGLLAGRVTFGSVGSVINDFVDGLGVGGSSSVGRHGQANNGPKYLDFETVHSYDASTMGDVLRGRSRSLCRCHH